MRLIIRRDQAERKGLFGGHKGMSFNLHCRVELSPVENDLIARYKVEMQPLTYVEYKGEQVPGLTIGDLINGKTYEVTDVSTLLNNEEVIKGACKDFKLMLEVMESFGGEEVLEF